MQKKINVIKSKFKCLDKWTIKWDEKSKIKNCVFVQPKSKYAIIYDFYPKHLTPKDYLIHEILHVALRAVFGTPRLKKLQKEEELIQNLSKMIRK